MDLQRYVEISNKISGNLNADKTIQSAVNEIAYELNLLGSIIFEEDEGRLYSRTFTQSWYTDLIRNLLPLPFSELSVSITDHLDNLVVQTYVEQLVKIMNNLTEVTKHAFPDKFSKIAAKLTGTGSGILFPLVCNDSKIGVIMFTQSYKTDFSSEKDILKSFADHVSSAIYNSREYERLLSEIQKDV